MQKRFLSRLNNPEWANRLLGMVIILGLLLTFWVFWPYLWDRYLVVRDLQNFYWMALFRDAELFPTDYLMKDEMLTLNVFGLLIPLHPASLGYSLFFFIINPLLDHIWLSKWLIVILMPLCITYLFKLARLLEDNVTAVSLNVLFIFFMLASYQSISLASGLQRAFAIPLLIMFFYYLLREQYLWGALLIVFSALFYWPNVPLMVVTYGLALIKVQSPFKVSLNLNLSKLIPLAISVLIALLVLVPELIVAFDAFVPKSVSAVEDPRFQSKGETPLFINFPWLGRAGIFDAGTDLINFLVLLILGILVYQVVGRKSFQRLPGVYWRLLTAAVVMYGASFVFLVGFSSALLYQPSRYTRSTLFLLGLLFVGLNWGDFLEKAPRWFQRKIPLLIVIALAFVLAFVVLYLLSPDPSLLKPLLWIIAVILSGVFVILGVSGLFWLIDSRSGSIGRFVVVVFFGLIIMLSGTFYIRTLGIRIINPTEAERAIYEYVESLPKDTVLAGEPVLMSGIPLFSKRSVLFRDLHPNVNPNVSALILGYFDAQYAESPETVLDFCQHYHVGYLILNTTNFTPEFLAKGEYFYHPWNDEIVKMVAGRSDFIIPHLQPVFTSEPFVVVKCDVETLTAHK